MPSSAFSLSRFGANEQALYAHAVELALAQETVDPDAPGHIAIESRARGGRYARWFRSIQGKQVTRYLGPEGGEAHREAESRLADIRQLAEQARLLRKLGFASLDQDAARVCAVLASAGVFRAGAVLVGTCAFHALLNGLGYRATPALRTEGIDLVRDAPLNLAVDASGEDLPGLLAETGLSFHAVPGLDRRDPPTAYKVRGKPLSLDLLVPARGSRRAFGRYAVPELGSHATALPHLGYLIEGTELGILLGRGQLIPSRVPTASHLAMHKIALSGLRTGVHRAKASKDAMQAAILVAVLVMERPEELEAARRAMPAGLARTAAEQAGRVAACLGDEHPESVKWLGSAFARQSPRPAPRSRESRKS